MMQGTATAPLEGIRVLALEGFIAGPYASMWLADMGAEVIKVEEPTKGEPARSLPPRRGDEDGRSLALLRANRNKQSVTLNLKDPRGTELFQRLLPSTDVVLDNLRHFAALKAMGTGTRTLVRMLCLQVVTVGVLGYGIGLGGATVAGKALGDGAGLAFEMPWQIPVFGLVSVVMCCVAAAMLGMVRVVRLEPGIVFKS